ncbi:MAG: hypothetical protein PHN38_09180 [Sulfurospirillaceae bacterium]|nr:hypothetical protein [Sulfurospirillaceae bacterium]
MIAIILSIALAALCIYYLIFTPYIYTKISKNKTKKQKIFILLGLLCLPFADHAIFWLIYKIVAFISCGATVYNISHDEQKQRDYWLNKYIHRSWEGPIKSLRKELLLTKDLKYQKAVYVNYCQQSTQNDCKEVEEYIQEHNLTVYNAIPRNKEFITFMTKEKYNLWYPLNMTYVINNDQLENAYINKCNKSKYIKETSFDYKFTCKKTNEIIQQLQLENVIELPPLPYEYNKLKNIVDLLPLKKYNYNAITKYNYNTIDKETGEILHEETTVSFRGGWIAQLLTMTKGGRVSCEPRGGNIYEAKIKPKKYLEEYCKTGNLEAILIPQNHYILDESLIRQERGLKKELKLNSKLS